MVRILILGGGGFIGTHLAAALLAAGHAVTVFERPGVREHSPASSLPGIEWAEGDFSKADDVGPALAGKTAIFHLVSTTVPTTSNANPAFDVSSNVVGTISLLEAARTAGVGRTIFLSSGGTVYGVPKTLPIAEDHPLEPISSYGIGKLAIESYLRLFEHLYGQRYQVVRLSNPFGPHQRPNTGQGVIATFLDRAMQGLPLEVWGDGSTVRDYIYVADVVEALIAMLSYDGSARVLNLGSGVGRSIVEIVGALEGLLGRKLEVIYRDAKAHDVPINVLDISQIRNELGWMPRTSLEAGILLTYQHLIAAKAAEVGQRGSEEK